jgi:hypothetical protein
MERSGVEGIKFYLARRLQPIERTMDALISDTGRTALLSAGPKP